ncbi:MAG: ATP-binding protein [Hyphomicrobiales bacterium]
MTRSSLQLRLFATAALAVVASLSLAGIGISAMFERQAQQLVAADLTHTLHLLLAQVNFGPGASLVVPNPPSDARFAMVYSGLYWQISDRNGVRLRSRSLWDGSLQLTFGEPDHTSEHVFIGQGPRANPVLIAERWVDISSPQGPVPLQIAVASDTGAITRARRSFDGVLASSLGLLALGLVTAAWAFVRSGLKPFDRLRVDLAAIHEGRVARLSGQYPDEVQPLVGDLNELLRRQEEIAARARARAADLAHGLKTPLAVLDALAAEARDAGQPQLADEIVAELSAMKGHVERELARARSGQAPSLVRQQTPARPIIERLATALGKIAGRDELRFEIGCAPEVMFVGSENDLLDMLGNILDNARKWATSLVRVTAEQGRIGLVIQVEDDGPGLSAEFRSEDIVRALRLDETHAGIGFGLAISKEIAEANRGTLQLAPSDLGGLKVTLAFRA